MKTYKGTLCYTDAHGNDVVEEYEFCANGFGKATEMAEKKKLAVTKDPNATIKVERVIDEL